MLFRTNFLYKVRKLSYEETFSTVQTILSEDSVYKVETTDLWKIIEDQVSLGLSYRVGPILLQFEHMAWNTSTNRIKGFRSKILPTDSSIYQQNILKILALKNISFPRYWSPKNSLYPTKDARIFCFLGLQYLGKETFFKAKIFKIFCW